MNKNYRIFTEEISFSHQLTIWQEIVRVRVIKNELQHYAGIVVSLSNNTAQIVWAEKFWFPEDLLKDNVILIHDKDINCASPLNEATCNLLTLVLQLKSELK